MLIKRRLTQSGFTLVDVMMGATILVVGLVGFIQAVLIGSEMQATARRQTLAAQIASNEIELLRTKDWATISAIAAGPSVMAWNPGTNYKITDLVSSGGTWYRCVANHINQVPPDTNNWAVYSGPISSTGVDLAATYTVTRARADMPNGLIEVTFTVTWTVKPTGYPLSRTYTRIVTAYYGRYGLNLSYQRT